VLCLEARDVAHINVAFFKLNDEAKKYLTRENVWVIV